MVENAWFSPRRSGFDSPWEHSTSADPVIPFFGFRAIWDLDRIGLARVTTTSQDWTALGLLIVIDRGTATRANVVCHDSPSY